MTEASVVGKAILGILAAVTAASVAAAAQRDPVPAALRSWLLAVEAVPDAAALRKAGGAATEDLLLAVAGDANEASYGRHRAVSFLGVIGGSKATGYLRACTASPDADLRATAALAWASGPGRRDAGAAAATMRALLADPVASVRAAAAHGLRWLNKPEVARSLADERLKVEPDPATRKALERVFTR
jgi:hypothetical protein